MVQSEISMTPISPEAIAAIESLAKAVSDMKHGGTHYDYADVLDKFTSIVETHTPVPTEDDNLAAAITALNETSKAQLEWFKAHESDEVLTALKETEARILDAIKAVQGVQASELHAITERVRKEKEAVKEALETQKPG